VPAIEGAEGARAAELYDRIFLGYGDDSVAQLGGAHIACEWTSNLLTKILQRPRLAAYLEQSTRYIAYDAQLDGFGYRYHRDPRFGPDYELALDDLFETYARLLATTTEWVCGRFLRGEDESAGAPAAARLGLGAGEEASAPSVRLLRVHGTEEELLAALLYESATVAEEYVLGAGAELGGEERASLLLELIGSRENRRHRPGRGLET